MLAHVEDNLWEWVLSTMCVLVYQTQVLGVGNNCLYLAGPKCVRGGGCWGWVGMDSQTYWASVLPLSNCVPRPCLGKKVIEPSGSHPGGLPGGGGFQQERAKGWKGQTMEIQTTKENTEMRIVLSVCVSLYVCVHVLECSIRVSHDMCLEENLRWSLPSPGSLVPCMQSRLAGPEAGEYAPSFHLSSRYRSTAVTDRYCYHIPSAGAGTWTWVFVPTRQVLCPTHR